MLLNFLGKSINPPLFPSHVPYVITMRSVGYVDVAMMCICGYDAVNTYYALMLLWSVQFAMFDFPKLIT